MTIKSNMLMLTAAAFISGSAAFAQTADTGTSTKPDLTFLVELFSGETAPTIADIEKALAEENLTAQRIRLDDDGEARIRFVAEDGTQYRVRIEDGKIRYRMSDDGMSDTSDANGEDTSDTSDSNGDSSDDNTSDGNGGSTSGGNSGSGGGSED